MADLNIQSVRVIANYVPLNGVAEEALPPCAPVRFNTVTGKLTGANATNATEAAIEGVAIDEATKEGGAIVYTKHALVDVGDALDALDFGDPVFLSNTDKKFADAAGTQSVQVGEVYPLFSGESADKVLLIDVR